MSYEEYKKNIEAMNKSIEAVNAPLKPVNTLSGLPITWENVGSVPETSPVKNAYDEKYLQVAKGDPNKYEWYDRDPDAFDKDGDASFGYPEGVEDISDEELRHYVFDNNRSVMIIQPQLYYMQEDVSHVIVDREEVIHIIPTGWIQLEIELLA